MIPARSCCGVTGTRPTTTVSPAESKSLNETKRKEQIPSERRVCVGCRNTLHPGSELEEMFPHFHVLHVPANGSAPPVTLCAAFLTRGVIDEENSLKSAREIIQVVRRQAAARVGLA